VFHSEEVPVAANRLDLHAPEWRPHISLRDDGVGGAAPGHGLGPRRAHRLQALGVGPSRITRPAKYTDRFRCR
jgi:hypothetical protein